MAEPQQATTAPVGDWFATNGIKTIPIDADALLREATARAGAGDMEGANAAFFQIPADERKARGLYAGPGGGDATTKGVEALAAATAIGSIGRAVMGGGPTVAMRALAGAKATVAQASPIIKYQGTKHLLEALGVSPVIAEPAATIIAGRKFGGAPAATTEAASAGGLSAAEEAGLTKQGYSPATIEKIRKAVSVTPAQGPRPPATAAPVGTSPAVRAPMSPAVAAETPAASAPTVAPPSAPAPAAAGQVSPRLLAAETKEYLRLLKAGKSSQEALQLIQAQRDLMQRLGLPSPEAVRRAVVDRNTSGRWPE